MHRRMTHSKHESLPKHELGSGAGGPHKYKYAGLSHAKLVANNATPMFRTQAPVSALGF